MKRRALIKRLDHHIGKKHMGLLVWKLKNTKSQFIRIDEYWLKVMTAFIDESTGKSKYDILFNFVMCVLLLPYGNSDQKEVSPLTNSYLIHMGTLYLTIECIRLLKDFLIRKGGGGGVENVDINKQMMKSCKASRER